MNKFRVLMLCFTKLYFNVHESIKCNKYQSGEREAFRKQGLNEKTLYLNVKPHNQRTL